jgi:hypothetical protein
VSERICLCRAPQNNEKEDIASMQRNAEVLEFFEDFYAGFLQILLQLYILMLQIEQEFQTKLREFETNFMQNILINKL